jgi:hypothetical protein
MVITPTAAPSTAIIALAKFIGSRIIVPEECDFMAE